LHIREIVFFFKFSFRYLLKKLSNTETSAEPPPNPEPCGIFFTILILNLCLLNFGYFFKILNNFNTVLLVLLIPLENFPVKMI